MGEASISVYENLAMTQAVRLRFGCMFSKAEMHSPESYKHTFIRSFNSSLELRACDSLSSKTFDIMKYASALMNLLAKEVGYYDKSSFVRLKSRIDTKTVSEKQEGSILIMVLYSYMSFASCYLC